MNVDRPSPSRPRPGLRGRLLVVGAVCGLLAAAPTRASAQAIPTTLGIAGGFVAGTYTMAAVYVLKARFGRYLFSLDDALTITPEMLPVVAGPIAGGWLGAESKVALGRAAGWGALGFLGGAALGVGAGHLIWGGEEGRWAGAIIGSATGLVVGAILGARDGLDSPTTPPTTLFEVRIPLGGHP